MNVIIYDNKAESINVMFDVLKGLTTKIHYFSDCISFFSFLNRHSDHNDLILMVSDEMFKDINQEINYFINEFDLMIPVFTYTANQVFLNLTMNYIYEYTKYYEDNYIKFLEKIKDAFSQFNQSKTNPMSSVSRFSEKAIYCKHKNQKTDMQTIFPQINYQSIDNEALASSLNQQQKQLLSYLASNYNGVKLEEIMSYIWKSNDESKQNAYVLIHSLKKLLESKTEGRYTIEKSCKKYKLSQIGA